MTSPFRLPFPQCGMQFLRAHKINVTKVIEGDIFHSYEENIL